MIIITIARWKIFKLPASFCDIWNSQHTIILHLYQGSAILDAAYVIPPKFESKHELRRGTKFPMQLPPPPLPSSSSYIYHGVGHLLTCSGLTYPEISSKICHDFYYQLENSVLLPWVIYYEAFYLHVVCSFSYIPVLPPKSVFNSFVICVFFL